MTENPDLRSVRVEVEASSGGSLDAPAAQSRVGASKLGIVTGVVGLGLAGVLIGFALRSNDRPSTDAEVAVPASATQVSEDVVGDDPATTLSDAPETLFEPTAGAEGLHSIVRAPVGFLALTRKESLQLGPRIVRSADGTEWVDVVVSFDDNVAQGGTDIAVRRYDRLIRTDSGYALLMTTIGFPPDEDPSQFQFRIQRLISPDGAKWGTDPDFVSLDSSGPSTRVLSHGPDSFVAQTWPQSPVNTALRDLLEANVDDGSSFEDACVADDFVEGQLVVFPCSEGEGRPIEAVDTVDPDRFAKLTECAVLLSDGSEGLVSFQVVHRDQAATELAGANAIQIPPMVTDDGRVVAIDFAGTQRRDPSACDGFGVDGLRPAAIVVWDPKTAAIPVRHSIPEDVDLVDLLSVRAEPALLHNDLLVLIGSVVTSIDIETGVWTEVLTLPVPPDDEASVRITTDGSQLIYLDSARVNVLHLDTGLSAFVESTGGNRPGFPSIIYADNEILFAQGGNSVFKVELPAA